MAATKDRAFDIRSGISFGNNVYMFEGNTDPTTAFTNYNNPPAGSLYVQYGGSGSPQVAFKIGSAASAWASLTGGIPTIGASSDHAIALWNGTGGNALQNSLVTIDASGNIVTPVNIQAATATITGYASADSFTANTRFTSVVATVLGYDTVLTPTTPGTTNAMLEVSRGATLGYSAIQWNETTDRFEISSNSGSTWYPILIGNTPGGVSIAASYIIFGDGADGDLVLASTNLTLGRDMYYNNLTLTGTNQGDLAK